MTAKLLHRNFSWLPECLPYILSSSFFPLFPLPYVQLHRLMCQAAKLFFAGEIVKESDEAGVIAQTEVAPFLIAP